ncbi:MAG: helix-turn-helix transcriptional regulator, partial [Clostridia bacterium]|nr:helix-turn-helix transcriptional regulator [Clostridia bacterium]
MDQYIVGSVIKRLREEKKLTQAQLADRLGVSDKAVSKWETGGGYPDITLLEPLA